MLLDKDRFHNVRNVVLTMSSRQDRTYNVKQMLLAIGENPDDYDFVYATSFPYNALIANAFNASKAGQFTKPNEYDCSRNHYNIIKTSYELGYDYVVVMEDDIQFSNDASVRNKVVKGIPEDFDLLQYGGFQANDFIKKLADMEPYTWVENKEYPLWTTSCYALSRKGMEYYIRVMNSKFYVADMPLYAAPQTMPQLGCKPYLLTRPIVIQADKKLCTSDIRDENNDKIDYNTQNAYEACINKNDDFFPYFIKKD